MPIVPIIGQWPSTGEWFVLFDCWALGAFQRICWTPTTQEWAQVRQVLGGLSELTKGPRT